MFSTKSVGSGTQEREWSFLLTASHIPHPRMTFLLARFQEPSAGRYLRGSTAVSRNLRAAERVAVDHREEAGELRARWNPGVQAGGADWATQSKVPITRPWDPVVPFLWGFMTRIWVTRYCVTPQFNLIPISCVIFLFDLCCHFYLSILSVSLF